MGSRLEGESDQQPEKLQHLYSKTESPMSAEGRHHINKESTKTEEPDTAQPGPRECKSKKKNLPAHAIYLYYLLALLFIIVFSLHSGRQQSLECI